MRDTGALYSVVHDKMMDQTFNHIVCEAFLRGVPIPRQDMTEGLTRDLVSYALTCLEAAGSSEMLRTAMKAQKGDPAASAFLTQINSICMEAADTTAERIIEEHKNDTDLDQITDAAEKAAMTEKEYHRFVEGAHKVSNDALGKVIQDKVLDTIKEEKEAYQKDAELEQEIRDAIKESDAPESEELGPENAADPSIGNTDNQGGFSSDGQQANGDVPTEMSGEPMSEEEANESFHRFMTRAYGPKYRAKHESVFSKLQELALESIICGTEKNCVIPLKTAALITTRNTFPVFKNEVTPLMALESCCRIAVESLGTPDHHDGSDPVQDNQKALLTAGVIYAFFETLNTMHLYCPGLNEVKQFVDETIPMSKMVEEDRDRFVHELTGLVNNALSTLTKATTVPEVEIIDKNLEAVREACVRSHAFETYLPGIKEKIETARLACENRKMALKAAAAARDADARAAVESEMDLLYRTRDTMKFSRQADYYGKKHNVDRIQCVVDPLGGTVSRKYVAVECFDSLGNMVSRSNVTLERAMESSTLVPYVTSAIKGSKLAELDKHLVMKEKGTGKILLDMDNFKG